MHLKPTHANTMTDRTPIFVEETAILGCFTRRVRRADEVATEDAGSHSSFARF
jgi:hypothetical protein